MMSPAGEPAHGEGDMRNDQRWDWSAAHASPLHCLLQQAGDRYDLTLSRDHREPGIITISVSRDHKPVYEWTGHAYSVFQIVGDRLYYADYSTSSSGGAVVAVDLATGKTLWREPLQALGPIEHSKYFNRLNLAADEAAVRVTGNESAGRYIEVKDAATGRTIANRQLPAEAADGT
jgi:outer membrane protein assembly factor BamB